ncbi:HAMP domain-containing sensor histidine kinase [Paraglaciecola aquimarina]|uniref:histidine kinase n=1 Tax=Paraglaciecola aquimarina TaxID=1235557 RepID=A0ABU3SXP8_9ALTE|nr:HAMP domain-containing sensor histidine kinase [Paraglaciecola aquimarina]MDU0354794.1 HAMP domain-containing sensor histidine kinase [Paraglaciecola aquimarina]
MQLNSLRQLTFVSFVVVLVPLAALVGYSQYTLTNIAEVTSSEAEKSIAVIRTLNKMERLAFDIERLVRQFTIVNKPTLMNLIAENTKRFSSQQRVICQLLSDQQNCTNLTSRIGWIKQVTPQVDPLLLNAQLADFSQNLNEVSVQVHGYLDTHVQKQQSYVRSVQQNQFWLTGLLLSTSILLILFGARTILKPIEKIEQVIGAIARQASSLPIISSSGPKELIVVEHQLHNLASRLTQLEKLRTALLRHASHELKTPLASIKEGCSLLTEQVVGPLNVEQKEVMSLLNSSTDRLNQLIVQLLDYNLLLQQANPKWELVDTKRLFAEFVTENSLALKQHDHKLDMKIEVQSILTDVQLYRRILDNLMSNAIAHGIKGRPITIHLYQLDNTYVLDFANRGQKIPEQQRDTLFQPFYRGKGSEMIESSALD